MNLLSRGGLEGVEEVAAGDTSEEGIGVGLREGKNRPGESKGEMDRG
jgi:hypothetical protein